MSAPAAERQALARTLTRFVGCVLAIDVEPHVEFATVDTVRHFAHGYGDDNPLFTSPDYAQSSVRGGMIAPPLFPIATGTPSAAAPATEAMEALRGMRHLPVRIWQDRWTLHQPIRLGTRAERTDSIGEVTFDDATAAIFVATHSRYEAGGSLFAEHVRTRHYGGPGQVAAHARASSPYSPDEIERIDAAYAAETRRGNATRLADEIEVGDVLGPIARGPLTMTDLIEYRAGVGRGPFGAGALRLSYLNRRRLPSFYDYDERGAHDARERCHWDAEYARSLGHPNAYDYSHTRLTWLAHLVTDWVGDGGWLHTIRFREHAPNYIGDTHWLTGTVTSVAALPSARASAVDLSLQATNQLGLVTCAAEAIVLVPDRPHTCVELPLPGSAAAMLQAAFGD